jgi:hypothetical protein
MKRFLVACAAALALVAFTGQKASANGGFGFRIGVSVGFDCSAYTVPACPPPCMQPAGCYLGITDYGAGGFGGGYHAAAPYTPTHVATMPAPTPVTTQQVGYQGYPSTQGYYPAYWYGN